MEEKTENKPEVKAEKPAREPKPVSKPAPKPAVSGGKIAVVLIRSAIQAEGVIKDSLFLLRLRKKNACVVLDANDVNIGMLQKVKDYVTYGPVSEDIIKLLKEKRDKGKKVFMLHPPRGGFERKGIKRPFILGGALGDRGDKMDALLKRMI